MFSNSRPYENPALLSGQCNNIMEGVEALRVSVHGNVLLPADEGFQQAIKVWDPLFSQLRTQLGPEHSIAVSGVYQSV